MEADTHQRVGNALLSFWGTVQQAPSLETERFKYRSAYDLAGLLLKHNVEQSLQGDKGGFDKLWPYEDVRGNVIGFMGKKLQKDVITVMLQDPTIYPSTIDYIEIPSPEGDEDSLVTHYAISTSGVALRACLLPPELVAEGNAAVLVSKIRGHRQPLKPLEPSAVDTVVRELYNELGAHLRRVEKSR